MIHKTTATTCTDMKKKSKKPVKKKVVIFVKGLAIRDEKKIIRRLDLKIIQKYNRKCTCSLVEEDNNHFIPRKKTK